MSSCGVLQADWPRGYWLPDMSKPCFTGWHLRIALPLGLPLLAVVCCGIPLLPYLLLRRHKRDLQTASVKLQLGFVYRSYKQAAAC